MFPWDFGRFRSESSLFPFLLLSSRKACSQIPKNAQNLNGNACYIYIYIFKFSRHEIDRNGIYYKWLDHQAKCEHSSGFGVFRDYKLNFTAKLLRVKQNLPFSIRFHLARNIMKYKSRERKHSYDHVEYRNSKVCGQTLIKKTFCVFCVKNLNCADHLTLNIIAHKTVSQFHILSLSPVQEGYGRI